jgi:hypothetical protein
VAPGTTGPWQPVLPDRAIRSTRQPAQAPPHRWPNRELAKLHRLLLSDPPRTQRSDSLSRPSSRLSTHSQAHTATALPPPPSRLAAQPPTSLGPTPRCNRLRSVARPWHPSVPLPATPDQAPAAAARPLFLGVFRFRPCRVAAPHPPTRARTAHLRSTPPGRPPLAPRAHASTTGPIPHFPTVQRPSFHTQ